MEYWWNVNAKSESIETLKFMHLRFVHLVYSTYFLVFLALSALLFIVYLKKVHGMSFRSLLRVYFMLFFVYTVLTSVIVLLLLFSSPPLSGLNPYILVVNMFTIPAIAALLFFSNVLGILELACNVLPKFFVALNFGNLYFVEVLSAALSIIMFLLGVIVFAYFS